MVFDFVLVVCVDDVQVNGVGSDAAVMSLEWLFFLIGAGHKGAVIFCPDMFVFVFVFFFVDVDVFVDGSGGVRDEGSIIFVCCVSFFFLKEEEEEESIFSF